MTSGLITLREIADGIARQFVQNGARVGSADGTPDTILIRTPDGEMGTLQGAILDVLTLLVAQKMKELEKHAPKE